MATHGLDWTAALAPLAGWPEAATTRDCRDGADGGAFRHLVTRFLVWRAQRETVRILSSVDSATLRDLGIADIESEVYGDPKDRMRGYDPCWWRRQTTTTSS
ncbi:MAG: hypothetical protein QOJ15_3007 [Bradyrhizobium sp.]|jgi:uncharacterized protein YjiS (DUF1127 family)|nr:hypothetical protein [Bradyrhizobium sp.]